jgi:hypothetical protein
MGSSSKVILVGATSLIVGVYAISLKNVQSKNVNTAIVQVNRVQIERLTDAALSLALHHIVFMGGGSSAVCDWTQVAALGGTVKYRIPTVKDCSATVFITVMKDGVSKNFKAIMKKENTRKGHRKVHRGEWQVTSVFATK